MAINPLLQILRPISPLAWIPISILWFGVGDLAAIFLIFLASLLPLTLTAINAAIQNVAAQRGQIGAGINRLQSASNVINSQTQNLTSAEDGIRAADIPQTIANLTKFSILEQTGIAALAQANQSQQLVLSLLK